MARSIGFTKKNIVSTAAVLPALARMSSAPALASSHRKAPFIGNLPAVDGTDLYMFRSYQAGRQDFVTMIANYIPFQDPQGGLNFFKFDQNGLYEISVGNVGDAKENITFQFRLTNASKGLALHIGDKAVGIPLNNSGTLSAVNDAKRKVRESYTIDLVIGDRRSGARLTNAAGGTAVFDKPVGNIGDKTFGSASGYKTYANQHIYRVAIPGCGAGRVFVGQRKEPFYIAVGRIFDLFNLNPLGPEVGGNKNDLAGKNISSIALEVPIACLRTDGDPVISAYTTSSVRQGRLINPSPHGYNNASKDGGAWAQV